MRLVIDVDRFEKLASKSCVFNDFSEWQRFEGEMLSAGLVSTVHGHTWKFFHYLKGKAPGMKRSRTFAYVELSWPTHGENAGEIKVVFDPRTKTITSEESNRVSRIIDDAFDVLFRYKLLRISGIEEINQKIWRQ